MPDVAHLRMTSRKPTRFPNFPVEAEQAALFRRARLNATTL
jgi:hypothetical protein